MNIKSIGLCLLAVGCLFSRAMADDAKAREHFETQIAPLLAARCLTCHNPQEKKGELDLTSLKTALKGGESGEALVPGKPEESLLWEKVSAGEMPPKKPLGEAEKKLLQEWLASGAVWGSDPIDPLKYSSDTRAGRDWWSLRPLDNFPAETFPAGTNPIDHFIRLKLAEHGLKHAPEADRRTLIRRLSFDLCGLPPSSEEVEAFVADQDPQAYEKLVDRLLNSPTYGERWARHWLDLVRFGESQGFERDKLRTTSWRYRDWVIQAFNQDMPYDEFVRLQLAGDVLHPDNPLAVVASGYWVAGAYDEVGQTQQSEAMRKVVRQDELEDLVGVTAQTFLGLTANCARCHDHKFDPVSQREYYRLVAAIGGVRHGERESLTQIGREATKSQIAELQQKRLAIVADLTKLEQPHRERLLSLKRQNKIPQTKPQPIARWEFEGDLQDSVGSLHGKPNGQAKIEGGKLVLDGKSYVSTTPLNFDLKAKTLEAWVKLGNLSQRGGGVITVQSLDGNHFDSLVFGEREIGKWFPGSNGFARSQDLAQTPVETEADKQFVHVAVVYQGDQTVTFYRNGLPYGLPYKAPGLYLFDHDKHQVAFGLRHSPADGNKFLTGEIERAQLYDRALSSEEIAASAGVPSANVSPEELREDLSLAEREQHQQFTQQLSVIDLELRLWGGGAAYTNVPREPEATFVLARGNPATPKEEVTAGGIEALGACSLDFSLEKTAPESQRRIKLAEWIVDPRNPLTPRVIANRLWQFHFGAGIVETPNDFGFNGTRPTHPQLLDWLAGELLRQRWSLKQLHRVIVTSKTYRESSQSSAEARTIDADNRFLWRYAPQRLEAEVIRDTVLAVTGELNPAMGGPGYQDFTTFNSNSQFYVMTDPIGVAFNRRSLYRTWVRSGRSPLLDVLDCPDPSVTTPKRAVTTTPLQALALLNNSFMMRMAENFAKVVQAEAPDDKDLQLNRAYSRAFQRLPRPEERELARAFIDKHGLAAFCRVLFNSNEFLYVD